GPRVDGTFVDPKGYVSKFELVPCVLSHGKGLSVVAVRRKENARADLWQVRRCCARCDERDSRFLKYPARVKSIGGIRVTNAGSGPRVRSQPRWSSCSLRSRYRWELIRWGGPALHPRR